MNKSINLHFVSNCLGLFLICIILLIGFNDQFRLHDLPCPLCLLQRLAFCSIGLGFCLNLQFGIKPKHYGLIILSALLGLLSALRQSYLHLGAGDKGYGDLFFGLHFYAWASILFITIILAATFALFLEEAFFKHASRLNWSIRGLMIFFIGLILFNAISAFMECGFQLCPDSPVVYEVLTKNEPTFLVG